MTTRFNKKRPGFASVQFFAIVTALSTLLIAAALRQVGEKREIRNGYHDASALVLAHSGVESALASIHSGVDVDEMDLWTDVRLTEAFGTLQVAVVQHSDRFDIRSCAAVESSQERADVRPGRRCVEVTATPGPNPLILTWNEDIRP